MSGFDTTKAIEHLQDKWGSRRCPMCGGSQWSIQDTMFQLLEYKEGNLVVGGKLMPVITVLCTNCSNTILVNAITSGIVAPSDEKEPK